MLKTMLSFFITAILAVSCQADPQLVSVPPTPTPVVQEVIVTPGLRNSCAIIATEAYTRLRATGAWTRMLYLGYTDERGRAQGHMVTVWQPDAGSPVLVYDQAFWDATVELGTRDSSIDEVVAAIGRTLPLYHITASHYVQ